MDLHDFTNVQQVAPAVNGFEEFALNIDRALLREGSGFQFPVKRPEDRGLILLRTGDETAVVGLDHLFGGRDVQAESFVFLDTLCSVPRLVDRDADHRRHHASIRGPRSGHVGRLSLYVCAHEHCGHDTHVRHRAERDLFHSLFHRHEICGGGV